MICRSQRSEIRRVQERKRCGSQQPPLFPARVADFTSGDEFHSVKLQPISANLQPAL